MSNILITGANRGIGLEFVRQYLESGEQVFASCRNPDAATDLQNLKDKFPGQLEVLPLDLKKPESISALGTALEKHGLDVVVNNAGIYTGKGQEFGSLGYDEWMEIMNVNVCSTIRVAETLLPHLMRGNRRILAFISSQMGSIGHNTSGGSYQYRSSKAALNAAAKSLAYDTKGKLKVAILHPGWVRTDMGGPNALIDAEESVLGMRTVLNTLTEDKSGSFLNYNGKEIPW